VLSFKLVDGAVYISLGLKRHTWIMIRHGPFIDCILAHWAWSQQQSA